jgi:hypothetical protein
LSKLTFKQHLLNFKYQDVLGSLMAHSLKFTSPSRMRQIVHGSMGKKRFMQWKHRHGLFIYIDIGYHGFYHEVNILRHSSVYKNWCQFFIHVDDYFEYLLGNPSYMGEKMFIMQRIERWELALHVNHAIMWAYNKMHAGFRVQMDWSIGGLKRKWRHFMKRFDSTKLKYAHCFEPQFF